LSGAKANGCGEYGLSHRIQNASGEEMILGEVRNLNHKLVGAISLDRRVFEIRQKDCITQVEVKPDGTLGVTHRRKAGNAPPKAKNAAL
jgi:hypothetical protein